MDFSPEALEKRTDKVAMMLQGQTFESHKVGNICDISRGIVIGKEYIRDHPGEYPVYSSRTKDNGILGMIDVYTSYGECLTWTTDGAYAGTVFYRTGKFNITNVCGMLKLKASGIDIRYLYHYLKLNAPSYVFNGMGNPKLMSNVMAEIPVLVPSIEIQNEIARILDALESYFTDIEKGLPAEIVARHKQLEYYRGKLLHLSTSVQC